VPLTPDWQPVTVSLDYRLGEIGLFEVRFKGMAYRRHFSQEKPFPHIPEPPPETSGHTFVFYPNYPIALNFTIEPLTRIGRWIAYTPYTFRNRYVDLKRLGSFDEYLKSFSSKSRSTLQRKVKKFMAVSEGSIRWETYRTADSMDLFFNLARTVSAKTYQERLLGRGLPGDDIFRSRAIELARAGGAYGFLLFLQERPIAYLFTFCTERIMTYDYLGYDPEAASLSPGVVLQYLVLEKLFSDRNVDIFDFTEGDGQHKATFSTDDCLCAKTYFVEPSIRNKGALHAHHALNRSVAATGRLLARLGVKSTIRKLIRKAA
jgi:CelD/BcsL family acetyltransferase involved in cellulose biosynthesis